MNEQLRVLLVEDSPTDAELVLRELRRAGWEPAWKRVETESDYLAQLDQGWQIILADYALPQFSGLRAVELLKQRELDIPIILVSGTIGEYTAVEAMRAGADDYVMKNSLERLGSAVQRELRVAGERQKRRRADQALIASEVRYRRLFESARDGILILGADSGAVVDVNPFLAELLGYPRQTFLGKKVWELGFFKDIIANQANFSELQQQKYVRYEDLPLEASDGRQIELEFVSNVYLVDGERVIQCNIRDITARRHAEAKLRESEAVLVSAQRLGQIGNWSWDVRAGSISWSDEHYRIFGWDRNVPAPTRSQLRVCYTEDSWTRLTGAVDRALTAGEGFDLELEVVRPDGTHRWTVGRGEAARGADGQVARLWGTSQDITERRSLESQLQQALKMESVGRLAGGVAHDFNNMLGVILGNAELALTQMDLTHPLYGPLEEIRKAAVRSADLTRQLLAFARKQPVAPKVLDLNDTVAGMLSMLRRLIGENVEVRWQPAKELWPVSVDPSQMDQVLTNLCVNAREAISGVGTITIESGNRTLDEVDCVGHMGCRPGDYALLTLTDDGCGMDKDTLSHLFEPFFTTKVMGKGTGLGLATVYGIVTQNHGFIDVHSEPNLGTTFKMFLPRHVGKIGLARPDTGAPEAQRGREVILLVEDELAFLRLTRKMLEHQGYTVLAATTPGEALRLAREHTGEIHLLMTDVVMPEMNGRVLARNLLLVFPHLRRLFMSGYTADVIAHQGILDEGVHFIQKPFSTETLAAEVRGALDALD
jgi:two-component system cell cycle sensor histidine kinase/response regulator CckA